MPLLDIRFTVAYAGQGLVYAKAPPAVKKSLATLHNDDFGSHKLGKGNRNSLSLSHLTATSGQLNQAPQSL